MTTGRLPEKIITALYKKNYKALEKFQNKDTVNWVDEGGYTLLNLAVTESPADWMMVRFLLDHGAAVDVRASAEQLTSLHFAAQDLRYDIAYALIEAGADVNAEDGNGNTPLAQVVLAADPKRLLIHLLLSHGADPDMRTEAEMTAKELAEMTGQQDLFANAPCPTGKQVRRIKTTSARKKTALAATEQLQVYRKRFGDLGCLAEGKKLCEGPRPLFLPSLSVRDHTSSCHFVRKKLYAPTHNLA